MHTEVTAILRGPYHWKADESPEPTAVDEFAIANPDLKAGHIAARLDGFLDNQSAGKPAPPDYPGTAKDHTRYAWFNEGVKYWRENTNIALGVITLPVVSQDRIAREVWEWRDNQSRGISYLGFRLYNPDNPLSVKEWEARQAAAASYNAPWYDAGLADVYRLLTIEGELKKWVTPGFAPPSELYGGAVETFYGANPQKVLDNLHAARRMGRVRAKWLVEQGWALNPEWKD